MQVTSIYSSQSFSSQAAYATAVDISPFKAMSITRLGLMGAVIGLRLIKQITSALEIPLSQVTFWVDSMNIIYWIHGQSRNYKPLVSHRVGEIHEQSDPNQWCYVPTKQNPADSGTRGLTVLELADIEMWWNGLTFFAFSESDWPKPKSVNPEEEPLTEVKAERRKVLENQLPKLEEESETQYSKKKIRFKSYKILPMVPNFF